MVIEVGALTQRALSSEELTAIERMMGNCDFSGQARREYLNFWEDCDVQAAPGSGKTTLLVAKLAVAARYWQTTRQGICVLSHTNAARKEIEAKLADRPEGTILLTHPHFVGTITAFVHRFLALPLLRGAGCSVTSIDNERFAEHALARLLRKPTLRRSYFNAQSKRTVAGWVSGLTLDSEICIGDICSPERIPVEEQPRLPGKHTPTRKELEELKADLVREGVFRFSDMTAIALCALKHVSSLRTALARRFPLVLVDEAQDTDGSHLKLIETVFRGVSVIQRLGDCNQTIFESSGGHWEPKGKIFDLGESLRFGKEIAWLGSTLTCRSRQTIEGRGPHQSPPPCVIVFPDDQREWVGEAYATMIAETWPGAAPSDAWAVGWVHRPTGAKTAISLCKYFPHYTPTTVKDNVPTTLQGVIRDARAGLSDGSTAQLHYAQQLLICAFARLQGLLLESGRGVTVTRFLSTVEDASVLRRLVRRLLLDPPIEDHQEWKRVTLELCRLLHPPIADAPHIASQYLDFQQNAVSSTKSPASGRTATFWSSGREITIRLGSIASVKGQTHESTLVVETTSGAVKDLQTALKVAAEVAPRPTMDNPKLLASVTNTFVAVTRPRRLLCLAVPESTDESLLLTLIARGWTVRRP